MDANNHVTHSQDPRNVPTVTRPNDGLSGMTSDTDGTLHTMTFF
jgi:hypothetical protein